MPSPVTFPAVLTLLALSLPALPAAAQETDRGNAIRWADAWRSFKSPVTTDAKYALLVGTGLTAVLALLKNPLVVPVQDEVSSSKPLGSFATVGDLGGLGITNALYTVGMLGLGESRDAAGMFQATLYSALIATGLKHAVHERRPDGSSSTSFPSRHGAMAFSFASYVGCRHSAGWGVAAYALAGLVGFSRLNDNEHYLHDVVAGATIGTAYGLGVCLSENGRDEPGPASTLLAAPVDCGAMAGITIRY